MAALNITGTPLYDGFIEGFLYIPMMAAQALEKIGIYNFMFWIGLFLFVVIWLRLLFGWD